MSTEILADFVPDLAPHWELIGHGLGLGDVVKQLKAQNAKPTSQCLDVFVGWIDRGREVSWDKFLGVLHRQGHNRCAKQIKERLTNNTVFSTHSFQHGVVSSHLLVSNTPAW